MTVTARGGPFEAQGRDEEMVANWPNQEMRKRTKSKLDDHRPHTGVADGGDHGVVGVAFGEGQEVAAHAVILLEMANDRFDGGPASQRPLDSLVRPRL
ncbi:MULTISPECIES: hypothetical protein [unclassified Mesorhizobium]|uniref:hypothetical protein n=1 Tax=unclassified Mesorhizobium TaxID=325217 RepID=UPI003339FF94